MPKKKTNKSVKKRVVLTKSGKVKRRKSGKSHLLTGKNAKRRRNLGQPEVMTDAMGKKFKAVLQT